MRRIIRIDGEAHVSASVHAYGGTVHDKHPWRGARAELLIVDCIEWDKDSRREGDVIEFEGSADALRRMLVDALRILDINEKYAKEREARICARSVDCPRCGTFADPMNEWHGNGHGRACYGLSAKRLELISAEIEDAPNRQRESDARHDAMESATNTDAVDPVNRGSSE